MAQFPILRLTHAGQEMAGMSQGGGKLTFVRVELGDGQLKEEDSIEALTGLKRSVMQLPLQGYLNEGNGKARLRFVIDNSALTVGFHNREVGILQRSITAQSVYTHTQTQEITLTGYRAKRHQSTVILLTCISSLAILRMSLSKR